MASGRPHATSLELGSGRASLRRGNRPPPHKLEAVKFEAGILTKGSEAPAAAQEPSHNTDSLGWVSALHAAPVPLRASVHSFFIQFMHFF